MDMTFRRINVAQNKFKIKALIISLSLLCKILQLAAIGTQYTIFSLQVMYSPTIFLAYKSLKIKYCVRTMCAIYTTSDETWNV